MTTYQELPISAARDLLGSLSAEYTDIQAKELQLDMTRGKPASAQLDLSMPLLDMVNSSTDCKSENGFDCRNYGVLDGIPEAKRLMASMLDDDPDNVIVFGTSSLTIMYDTVARCLDFGSCGSAPWASLDTVKWICPSPGFDRHFAICDLFGIEMLPVAMNDDGPDMDEVERLVSTDTAVKGIWCVPKYSNPSGVTYSDDVVRRLASMDTAAEDFRIFWDNAYCVHHLYDDPAQQDQLLDIGLACREAGNPNRYFKFSSTSKVTFPGSGVAAMASSPQNVKEMKSYLGIQTIGHDKLNQLRHVRFLRDADGIREHMSKHAAILRPKFELVLQKLEEGLGEAGIATWSHPRGGYFVSFDGPEGTARRLVELADGAGVKLTSAGATWPYGYDPKDSNLRIAPSLPPLAELETARDVFVLCAKIAALEKIAEP